tara:strand:+ start:1422 stop:2450 length:1029 start_codon:yes stop_codon:yes gene_type:complete
MSNPIENSVSLAILHIAKHSPKLKDSTKSTYARLLRKFYKVLLDETDDLRLVEDIPKPLYEPKKIILMLEDSDWGKALKDRSRKNYLSLILTLFRPLKETQQPIYDEYRKAFDILKGDLDAKQIQQEPTENEQHLKDITMLDLRHSLNHHFNKIRGAHSKDIKSAMLNMLGHLHLDEVLRNEASDMVMTNDYLPVEIAPKLNFIWLKGRNVKLMVIRNNKVRNPDRGDEPKEVYIKGKLNTAINKYTQILTNNGYAIDNYAPLVYSKSWGDNVCISSSHYSQVFKEIWAHRDLELTTTMVRKIYAMDIRNTYKGNLVKEIEACKKLDHSQETHNKHYILNFD